MPLVGRNRPLTHFVMVAARLLIAIIPISAHIVVTWHRSRTLISPSLLGQLTYLEAWSAGSAPESIRDLSLIHI